MSTTESAREALRREHGVRLVDETLEGVAVQDLPAGIYGFTGSPLLASPLFAVRRYRNFEVHRLTTGPAVIGFVMAAEAAKLSRGQDAPVTLRLYPEAEGDSTTIVSISYDRVVQHRQYAVLNADALTLQVHPADVLAV